MRMTPLHQWAQEKTGGLPIEAWQLKKLRDTLTLARNSLFYRERLPGTMPEHIADIRRLPLMEMGTMVRQEQQLLCVPPQEIQRIVTIWTSGTTGRPKRLYFTAQDLELTIDFFARGLPTLVKPGDVMAVMMPCRVTSGVGDLICRGLKRIPVDAVPWGPLTSFAETKAMLQDKNVTSIVGMPAQVLALTRYLAITNAKTSLQSVLLSADNISPAMVRELKERGLQVYLHFGMTETGYGCAIDCDAHAGQHIREPDLLVEIVDPITGQPMPDGHWGEIVITTLTRRGMPLIRYRTGDYSRILPGTCPCGSTLRRLDNVHGRWNDGLVLPKGTLRMPALDQALFAFPQVMDFSVHYTNGLLSLYLATFSGMPALTEDAVRKALAPIFPLTGVEIAIEIEPCDEYVPLHQTKRSFATEGGAS
ncbi:MAG: DVU_1553 family AMP-dependent CoA ligase [Oscillospiraceae bacterium]|jgi:phenylacetate-CoA ligase